METILNFSRYKKSKQDIADAITDKGYLVLFLKVYN